MSVRIEYTTRQNYDPKADIATDNNKNDSVSLTVPDQTMEIKHIIEKFTRGQVVPGYPVIFDPGIDPETGEGQPVIPEGLESMEPQALFQLKLDNEIQIAELQHKLGQAKKNQKKVEKVVKTVEVEAEAKPEE